MNPLLLFRVNKSPKKSMNMHCEGRTVGSEIKIGSECYNSLVSNIQSTCQWLDNELMVMLKPFGITEPQFSVLSMLYQRGKEAAMNLMEIQTNMVRPMSNVSRLVDRLCQKGYAIRTKSIENTRSKNIGITQKGLDLIMRITPQHQCFLENLEEKISPNEAELFNALLLLIRKNTS